MMELYRKEIQRVYEPDVLVCGLGPSGISAAVAAARMGASTMAVERCPFAGGNFTAAKVVGICGAVNSFTGALITGGIVDSFSMVSLKRFLERKYDIRIPDADASPDAFDTVDKIKAVKTGRHGMHADVPETDVVIERAEIVE